MKLEKKHWIIIAVVLGIIAVWYFFLRKKKTESSYTKISCPKGYYFSGGKCIPYDITGQESNLTGAAYYDCRRKQCAGLSTSECDVKCGRGSATMVTPKLSTVSVK